MRKIQRVCVLGLGYIGLPTAAVLATSGLDVVGVDTDPDVLETLRCGKLHIEEPGLQTVVEEASRSGRLSFAEMPEPADVFIICVPTPLTAKKTADLSYVVSASETLVPYLRAGNLVIIESTVPPGTARDLVAPILRRSGVSDGRGILLVHCPERVIPGQVLREIVSNDRVIGGESLEATERARELYERFVEGELHLTDATTAEMIKLVENTFRDVNIALANELSSVCTEVGVNAWDVIKFANQHPRVVLHQPGPGVGGHCISVDPWFLVECSPDITRLIRAAREINDEQPRVVMSMIEKILEDIEAPRIVLLGMAYKGNVDDTRESPTLQLTALLDSSDVEYVIVDPHVERDTMICLSSPVEAYRSADLIVLMTDHDEFREIDPHVIANDLRNRRVLDTRDWLDRERWECAGFTYHALGA